MLRSSFAIVFAIDFAIVFCGPLCRPLPCGSFLSAQFVPCKLTQKHDLVLALPNHLSLLSHQLIEVDDWQQDGHHNGKDRATHDDEHDWPQKAQQRCQ